MKKNVDGRIEVITVRLMDCGDTHIFNEILHGFADVFSGSAGQLPSVKLYKSGQVENDWAIYLYPPISEKNSKSSLAISIAEAFRTVGLVQHTVWKSCDMGNIDSMSHETTLKHSSRDIY